MKINDVLTESPQLCPECGGPAFSDLLLAEKKDACYHKVKASAKVWPSAYASGRLVQCRKKGADNYGKSKNEGVAEGLNEMDKTQTSPGRDGDIDWTKKQIHLGPEHVIKAKDVAKHALKALDKTMKKSHADTSKKKGVAEGYSLKKTSVNKYMEPGDPDEYEQDVNIKDTDYEIINNKTGQVVGTASWTTNDFFGPGALKITMRNGATRYLDIWEREKGNPQTAFNRFVKDPKTAKKYKEQGVAEAGPFSYGKAPRKGSVADLAAKKRKEQEKGKQPVEPNDQMVGVAKVTKGVAEGPGFDKWADDRAASQLHKLKKPHPETWHDVDPKLGKAVNKMIQAEKVAKGLAHPDTLKKQGVAEGRTKAEINFDIEDIKRLEQINNLESIKQQAFELISRPSAHPMKPEKVSWFKSALERMDSPMKVIKLMYDLYLSGEGKSVLGTRHSMDPNSYRRRFGESQADDNPVADAIYRRLMNQKPDLFTRYGLEYVAQAVEDVADSVGRLGPDDEIGSSDVSGWVRQVEQNLRDRINQYDEPMTDIDRMEETHRPGHKDSSPKNTNDLIGGRYDPDEFDQMVLRLKQMAQKQERERGPVDLKDLVRKLRGADNA